MKLEITMHGYAPSRDVSALGFAFQRIYPLAQMAVPKPICKYKQTYNMYNHVRGVYVYMLLPRALTTKNKISTTQKYSLCNLSVQ